MRFQLIDRNQGLCDFWEAAFVGCPDVVVHCGDFFSLPTDCVVSPANSFGFMDGGLDAVITKKLGGRVQQKLQHQIWNKYYGELLVGQAELVETERSEIPFCISAPTMRVPMIIGETPNVYLATRAVFLLLREEPRIETVTMSGMGTGVGKVTYETCARQMKKAYEDFWVGNYTFPTTWKDAQTRHQLLYSNSYRDLQFRP